MRSTSLLTFAIHAFLIALAEFLPTISLSTEEHETDATGFYPNLAPIDKLPITVLLKVQDISENAEKVADTAEEFKIRKISQSDTGQQIWQTDFRSITPAEVETGYEEVNILVSKYLKNTTEMQYQYTADSTGFPEKLIDETHYHKIIQRSEDQVLNWYRTRKNARDSILNDEMVMQYLTDMRLSFEPGPLLQPDHIWSEIEYQSIDALATQARLFLLPKLQKLQFGKSYSSSIRFIHDAGPTICTIPLLIMAQAPSQGTIEVTATGSTSDTKTNTACKDLGINLSLIYVFDEETGRLEHLREKETLVLAEVPSTYIYDYSISYSEPKDR